MEIDIVWVCIAKLIHTVTHTFTVGCAIGVAQIGTELKCVQFLQLLI